MERFAALNKFLFFYICVFLFSGCATRQPVTIQCSPPDKSLVVPLATPTPAATAGDLEDELAVFFNVTIPLDNKRKAEILRQIENAEAQAKKSRAMPGQK